MTKIVRTAPELERLVLNELATAAICSGITAVTVTPMANHPETNWEVSHINVPGSGIAPRVCIELCAAAVAKLRQEYDLLLEIEASEL
jgi:hypothetical protein